MSTLTLLTILVVVVVGWLVDYYIRYGFKHLKHDKQYGKAVL